MFGFSVASIAASAPNFHFADASASYCSSESPVAHFWPRAVNSEATWRLSALAMYSCTQARMGSENRERPSGCSPSGRKTSATMRGSPMTSGSQLADQARVDPPLVISQHPRGV